MKEDEVLEIQAPLSGISPSPKPVHNSKNRQTVGRNFDVSAGKVLLKPSFPRRMRSLFLPIKRGDGFPVSGAELPKVSKRNSLSPGSLTARGIGVHGWLVLGISFSCGFLSHAIKYWGEVAKEYSRRKATDIINDLVILEPKYLLLPSELSIGEIAEALGVSNQSFFGKYFKLLSGGSPKVFREIQLY